VLLLDGAQPSDPPDDIVAIDNICDPFAVTSRGCVHIHR